MPSGRYHKGWSKDHEAIFKLYITGATPAEIVSSTGLAMVRVRNIIRTQRFQEHKDKVMGKGVEAARKLLEERLLDAAGTIIRIMKTGKSEERIKFDAAKEVLYQCGMKPVEVVENRTRQYSPEEIASSLNVIKEIKTIEGVLSTQGSEFLVQRQMDESPSTLDENTGAPSDVQPEEVTTPNA